MNDGSLISAKRLTKSYQTGDREQRVLSEIDLEIPAGEFVVMLGRSGSGKSTLLNLLGAMDRPTSGVLSIGGLRIDQLDEAARTRFRRSRVGFVFQAFNLIPTLTVRENLLLPLSLNGRDEEAGLRIREQLDALNLDDKADRYPDQLSGGEQQRVAVARALIHEPALVVADEPTGNLDLETGREVLALLDRMTREAGKTLVMATHSREVIGIADRVVTIRDGRLVETAPS